MLSVGVMPGWCCFLRVTHQTVTKQEPGDGPWGTSTTLEKRVSSTLCACEDSPEGFVTTPSQERSTRRGCQVSAPQPSASHGSSCIWPGATGASHEGEQRAPRLERTLWPRWQAGPPCRLQASCWSPTAPPAAAAATVGACGVVQMRTRNVADCGCRGCESIRQGLQ